MDLLKEASTAFRYVAPTSSQRARYKQVFTADLDVRIERGQVLRASADTPEELEGPLKTWVSGFNASVIVWAGSTDTVSAVAPGITASHAASYALDHTADDSQLACAVLALSATGKVEDRVSACLSGSNVNDRHSGGSKHASNSRPEPLPRQLEYVAIRSMKDIQLVLDRALACPPSHTHTFIHLLLTTNQAQSRTVSSLTIAYIAGGAAPVPPGPAAASAQASGIIQQREGVRRVVDELFLRQGDDSGEAKLLQRVRECVLCAMVAPLVAGNVSTTWVLPACVGEEGGAAGSEDTLAVQAAAIHRCIHRTRRSSDIRPTLHSADTLRPYTAPPSTTPHAAPQQPAQHSKQLGAVQGPHSRPRTAPGSARKVVLPRIAGTSKQAERPTPSQSQGAHGVGQGLHATSHTDSMAIGAGSAGYSTAADTAQVADQADPATAEPKITQSGPAHPVAMSPAADSVRVAPQAPPKVLEPAPPAGTPQTAVPSQPQDPAAAPLSLAIHGPLSAAMQTVATTVTAFETAAAAGTRPGGSPDKAALHALRNKLKYELDSLQSKVLAKFGATLMPAGQGTQQGQPMQQTQPMQGAQRGVGTGKIAGVGAGHGHGGRPASAGPARPRDTGGMSDKAIQLPRPSTAPRMRSASTGSPTRAVRSPTRSSYSSQFKQRQAQGVVYTPYQPQGVPVRSPRSAGAEVQAGELPARRWSSPRRALPVPPSPDRARAPTVSPSRRASCETLRRLADARRSEPGWRPSSALLAAWHAPDAVVAGKHLTPSVSSTTKRRASSHNHHHSHSTTHTPRTNHTNPHYSDDPSNTHTSNDTSPYTLQDQQSQVQGVEGSGLQGRQDSGKGHGGGGIGGVVSGRVPIPPLPSVVRQIAMADRLLAGYAGMEAEVQGAEMELNSYAAHYRAARLRTTSTGGLSEDTVTLTDPSRHTQHSYEDPAGTSHDSIDTGIGSEGVQEMLTGLATKPPGQASPAETQVSALLRVVQRERRARDASDSALKQLQAAREEEKASAHLRDADLVAEISRQRAVIDALTHQLPTNLQPLAALYEAHITQAEGRVEELTRTNMQLAARVADLELDVLEATHAGYVTSKRQGQQPAGFARLKQQVKELGDRCAAAESQARDAQRLARVHALAAKQAAAASARRTTA